MEELTLTTPTLLFSAVSLILLAYTNRFLSYAQLVRQLRDRYMENPSDITVAQIDLYPLSGDLSGSYGKREKQVAANQVFKKRPGKEESP